MVVFAVFDYCCSVKGTGGGGVSGLLVAHQYLM